MSSRTVALWSILSAFPALLGSHTMPAASAAPARLRVTVTTLHAATLTTSRAIRDEEDAPYLLVSILGPRASTSTVHLPAMGHLRIHEDEALGPRPLVDLTLQPNDSVRLLVSVLESTQVQSAGEARAATASIRALTLPSADRASLLSSALAPVVRQGAHWIGSAVVLLTNEGGTTYWRVLECVATCKVLRAPAGIALVPDKTVSTSGVVELSGAGGTYHLQLQGQRQR